MISCTRAPKKEPNALRLVEKNTSIPTPGLIEIWEYDSTTHIIITCLPGVAIRDVYHLMSYQERDRFADDIKGLRCSASQNTKQSATLDLRHPRRPDHRPSHPR
ncbi:hypothetical protein BDW59DRAFT_138220, partial [Aspergillus cavernicola]